MNSKIKSNKPSINKVIIPLIIIIVMFSLCVNIILSYSTLKAAYETDIKNDTYERGNKLSRTISRFVESFSINEYDKLIQAELKSKEMVSIVVNDFNMAKVLAADSFFTGKIKVDGAIVSYDNQSQEQAEILSQAFYTKMFEIYDNEKNVIGTIEIYQSDDELKSRLTQIIFNNLIYGAFVSVLLIGLILFVLKKLLFESLEVIVQNIDDKERLAQVSKNVYSKEMDILLFSIVNMLNTIKISNEKLLETKHELIEAQKVAHIGHFSLDLIHNNFESSEEFDSIFNFTQRSERTSDSWIRLIHEKDKDKVIEYFNYVKENDLNFDKKYRIITSDNQEKWVHEIAVFIKDEHKTPIKLFGTIQDITKNIEYETQLEYALTVFNNTHEGIMITNEENKIVKVNNAFEKITGYCYHEVIGRNPRFLKSEEHSADFYKNMWDELALHENWSGEIVNKNNKGELFYELLSINVIKDEDGNITNYIGVFSDITFQKNQERILLQQSRTAAVGEMIGNIAHQWRQPLSAISSISSGFNLLMESNISVSKEELIEGFKNISAQTNYLSKTIDDFRSFYIGNQVDVKWFEFASTIEKVKGLTKDNFSGKFIDFKYTVEEGIWLCKNENLLLQALINIFNNAKDILVEHLEEKRYFELHGYKKEENLYIVMKDNGGGVSSQVIEKIFEPYFTTKHESMGTGLGLYMAHQIIKKQMSGQIYVENTTLEYEGKKYHGAQFTIIIPLSSQDEA
jgi:PAS domain S-box-containing protein